MAEPTFTIKQISPTESWGTAAFVVSTMTSEVDGVVSFKITNRDGVRTLQVLDPFGGQNPKWLEGITGTLKIDLSVKGLL